MLLGVADDGSVEGLPDDRDHQAWVMKLARDSCAPPLKVRCDEVRTDAGQRVLLVRVPKGPHKPHQTSDGRFLVCVGSTPIARPAPRSCCACSRPAASSTPTRPRWMEGSDHRHPDATRLSRYFQRSTVAFDELPTDERLHLLRNTDILAESTSTPLRHDATRPADANRSALGPGTSVKHKVQIVPSRRTTRREPAAPACASSSSIANTGAPCPLVRTRWWSSTAHG